VLPAIDSASGAVGWALALTFLGPLAVFGFACSVWNDTRVGLAAALLLDLTSAYPYGVQLYSVWPMAAGLLLTLGLWSVELRYVAQPSPRFAVLGGLFAGALMLTHGTEIYTVALGLALFAAARWRRVLSISVLMHVGLAFGCAVLVVTPYFPSLEG
jgi:hypothetical protein